ncbi:hypothetical protein ACA910_018645 [Epithemia clementina (nom. ined.)]
MPNPRLVAQDAVQYYGQELDPYETHVTNIQYLFRPIVLSLTYFILLDSQPQAPQRRSSWKDYLDELLEPSPPPSPLTTTTSPNAKSPPSSSSSLSSSSTLPALDPRSKARLDAFVNGVLLAVPSAPTPRPTKPNTTTTTTKHNMPQRAQSLLTTKEQQQRQEHNQKKKNNNNNPNTKPYRHSISLLDGLAGFNSKVGAPAASLLRSISNASSSSNTATPVTSLSSSSSSTRHGSVSPVPEHAQISLLDLQIRLELYLRTLLRVVAKATATNTTTKGKQPSAQQASLLSSKNYVHCVLGAEPPRALNARVEAIATAFSETVGTVRQQGPVLTKLITYMTMELLAVPCLSEACQSAIRRVVENYEHQTSFASLAFLSTPEDAADQKLVPLLHRYFSTLQQNWQATVRDCELETMLQQVLDPEMRHFFKTVEFASIGHLLETCASYRPLLQRIELPPKQTILGCGCLASSGEDDVAVAVAVVENDEAQVRQAIRDLQRERITINGNLLPPVTSRSELLRILSQTLNLVVMDRNLLDSGTQGTSGSRQPRRGRSKHKHMNRPANIRRSESAPSLLREGGGASSSSVPASPRSPSNYKEDDNNNSHNDNRNNSHNNMSVSLDGEDNNNDDSVSEDLWGGGEGSFVSGGAEDDEDGGASLMTADTGRSRAMDMSTVNRLMKRLLLAASRTGTGGDAYFIVSDLFGGKDVQVVASPDLRGAGGIPTRTLEMWLHLGSLTIQCHTSFDVYPKLKGSTMADGVDPYSIIDDSCEPLIQLHTTTTEVIALQEVRAADAADGKKDDGGLYVLQERVTPKTGWKTLSIRPALYEKLQVWTTPS